MGIQHWSENIILVDLSKEPEMSDELETIAEIVYDREDCDVVIDFSDVDIITSSSLSKLLKLHKPITKSKHRLVLCSVAAPIKGILKVTGLDQIFEIADDRFIALVTMEMTG